MSSNGELTFRSPAKINWLLRVLGKRDDGFHEIETLFQTISLHDLITCTPASEFSLSCSDPAIPVDRTNLVSRAVEILGRLSGAIPAFSIHIEKAIPSGGGLGGGSSNAATILRQLRDRFDPGISEIRLHEAALELGSDVPFFLAGGTSYAAGRGEELVPMPSLGGILLLLVLPEERVATPLAYRLLGRGPLDPGSLVGSEEMRRLVRRGPLSAPNEFTNDFEEVIFERLPGLREYHRQLLEQGAVWARMSGSGSTLVGAFADEDSRERAERSFREVRVVRARSID